MLSEVRLASYSYRWDSTYFLKEFLAEEVIFSKWTRLKEICSIKSGTTPRERDESLNSGVILLKTNDIRNNVLLGSRTDYFYIDEVCNQRLLSSELKGGDVLINIVGATTDVVGRTALVPIDFPKANITQAMSFLRITDNTLKPTTLFLFLQSKYGINQTRRIARPTGQYNINNEELGSYRVPKLSAKVQIAIERFVNKAYTNLVQAELCYCKAENLLLEELGLTDWHPSNSSFNIKSLKASFLSSGRLDAEHYQVKFDELEAIIESVPHKTIAELQSFNARGVQPDYVDGGGVSVVNSKHILEDGLDYDNFEHTTADFLSSHERARIGYGDILIYTTGANIGRTQVYLRDGQAIASNHVNILRVKGVNPIYLALVLNSPVGRMQTEKLCTGSAQAEIYPSDIEKFVVPILDETTQESIAAKVQECFAMKTESKRLLNAAKEAVEIAISDSEEKALQYIKNKRMTNTGEKL